MPFPLDEFTADHLFTPREVANIFGVRTTTVARWARDGRLAHTTTPGGHRRYPLLAVKTYIASAESEIFPEDAAQCRAEQDAARLYEAGWSIRQVADRFECSYSSMRRILIRRTVLRSNYGAPERSFTKPEPTLEKASQ